MKFLYLIILSWIVVPAVLATDRVTGKLGTTRSEVIAANAMAATSQPLATQIALQIMRDGGNAIDAAIAGAGVALASKTLASSDLESQRLVIPFGPELRLGVRYQIVHRKQSETCDYLEAFKAWVCDELRPYHPPSNATP